MANQQQNDSIVLKLFRIVVSSLTFISPRIAGHFTYYLWCHTQRSKEPAREKDWLAKAKWSQLQLNSGRLVQLYEWGTGEQTILLIHGWNGRGAQLGQVALTLSEMGFRIIAFDLPGHGRSAGNKTDIPAVSSIISSLEQRYGPFYAAVSHSFGGMCLMHALAEGVQFRRIICIATPLDVAFLIDEFARTLQLSQEVITQQKHLTERRFGDDVWQKFSMLNWTTKLTIPGLLIHDRDDRYVAYEHAQEIEQSWSTSQLMLTEKLGHHRILREEAVIKKIARFLSD